MPSSSSERNPVEVLADEFVARQRRGERPSLSEYTGRYPQYADEIRDLFPALVMMEQLKPAANDRTGPYQTESAAGRHPERLGDYRILREVGRGGMGVVYEAEQVSLGRHVALKVLPASALLDAQRLQRFQREAKAAARLHHTNIVPVFGVGEADGLHFYVMQFITGLGLHEVLEELKRQRETRATSVPPPAGTAPAVSAAVVAQSLRTGKYAPPLDPAEDAPGQSPRDGVAVAAAPPSPALAQGAPSSSSTLREEGGAYWQGVARIGLQAAEALAHAHVQGVLHRDVKPSNVLLDTAGNVWITDFGLAKMLADPEDLTHTGDVVGTPRYMAPERFNGRGDGRSDLYSLGLTLYELLTLRPAFTATDRTQLIHKVLHETPVRPRLLNAKVPRDLETVVLKATDKEPGRRYATARELADDLQRFLEDRPIKARPVGLIEKGVKWARRRPAVAGLLAAAAVLAVLALGGIGYALRQDALHKADLANEEAKRQTEIAEQERANTREQERLTKVARGERDRAEEIMARSLLRPLGHLVFVASVHEAELDALWELAESPSDRVRQLFLEQALRLPGTRRQLRNRRDLALHAAVGLDRTRCQRAVELLLARLDDEREDVMARTDYAEFGLALGDPNPESTKRFARALADVLPRIPDPWTLSALTEGLGGASARLGPDEAAAVARALADKMTKPANQRDLATLGRAFPRVSARLSAEDAAAAARALAGALEKTSDRTAQFWLADGLRAVSARLRAEDATAVARALADATAKTTNAGSLRYLAEGLAGVSVRLSSEDAARYAGAAARALTDAMAKPTEPTAPADLADGLRAVSARLGPDEAAAAARALTDALTKRASGYHTPHLAQGLQAVSLRLGPGEAAPHAAAAARALTDAMTRTTNAAELRYLAEGLGAVSDRLGADDAAKYAGAAARTLTDVLARNIKISGSAPLMFGLKAVSARLSAEDAAAASRALADAMAKTANATDLRSLADGLAGVSVRLSSEDAARYAGAAARALTNAMANPADANALLSLGVGLAAVSNQLSPEDAAAAACALTDAMARTTDPLARGFLASGLQLVSARLGAEDGVAATRATIDAMANTTNQSHLLFLADGLEAVSARLSAADIAASARALTDAMARDPNPNPNTLGSLARRIRAVSQQRLGSNEAGPRAVLLARGIGESMSPATRLSGLATLTQAAQPLPSRLSTQQLVDLLKMPTCVGPGRGVILEMLGQRYQRRFADQWEFVEYTEKQLPDIDLKSPPKRPGK
jgi:serine/threonine protein kinase